MGYVIASVKTYCGFSATHRVPCNNCRVDNTWQKLSPILYRCTRCRTTMSMHENMINKVKFADSQLELKQMEEEKNETN